MNTPFFIKQSFSFWSHIPPARRAWGVILVAFFCTLAFLLYITFSFAFREPHVEPVDDGSAAVKLNAQGLGEVVRRLEERTKTPR